ncbi:imidazoleglycerol-phosphate dehydratase [Candidatus Carsonella ruddii]|uniref:Imidazoleglycerol-phosphate dehydratase n=1 Tax=Candidatus Carsonella ruddii CE isolate Thao2000 TaxID=1202536 RepID=J7GVX9_CARRU|nr:imidazoleglycerol-phosphate dehydratase [Candidatus Carsonella ruddii]AFP83546.1 imidazoleglycerol-phosphate dehydratase [Candidatus Carsonella ruddii CE isolate Thao2000]
MNIFQFRRKTLESDIEIKINFKGKGIFKIKTFIYFFDHIISQFFNYSLIDCFLRVFSDLKIDNHHSIEDIGICLGKTFNYYKFNRYNSFFLCMDETFVFITIDICNRFYYFDNINYYDYDFILIKEFFLSFSKNLNCCIHIYIINFINKHHLIECIFKSFGSLFYKAKKYNKILSTKGYI